MPSARAATPEGAEPDKLSRASLASTIAGKRELVCRAICKSGKFETGEGTCSFICMQLLGDARRGLGCPYAEGVHGPLADKILTALGES